MATHSGFLTKQAIKSRRNWKKRWFELSGTQLQYFKNAKVKGTIELMARSTVETCAVKPFCFVLSIPTSLPLYAYAEGAAELNCWIKSLRAAIDSLAPIRAKSRTAAAGGDGGLGVFGAMPPSPPAAAPAAASAAAPAGALLSKLSVATPAGGGNLIILEALRGARLFGGNLGLRNLGNTCFMASALQCLSHTTLLTDYFLAGKFADEINGENPLGLGGVLAKSYAELLEELWPKDSRGGDMKKGGHVSEVKRAIAPVGFKRKLARFAPQFAGVQQHDAQELMSFLLDGLHEDLNRVKGAKPYTEHPEHDGSKDDEDVSRQAWEGYLKRDRSCIVDLFQGQLRNELACKCCGTKCVKFEPYMYSSLPLSKVSGATAGRAGRRRSSLLGAVGAAAAASRSRRRSSLGAQSVANCSLQDCLRWYCETEQLEGDNQWYCPTCKEHRDATKELSLWKMPHILIVHLKRFSTNMWGEPGPKSTEFISFPVDDPLDLSELVAGAHSAPPIYDLYAVCNHHGTPHSGHYTAFARHADGQWLEFDDARVSRAKASSVCSRDAYVLFYARRSPSSQAKLVDDVVRRQTISAPENWPFPQAQRSPAMARQSTVGAGPPKAGGTGPVQPTLRKFDSY